LESAKGTTGICGIGGISIEGKGNQERAPKVFKSRRHAPQTYRPGASNIIGSPGIVNIWPNSGSIYAYLGRLFLDLSDFDCFSIFSVIDWHEFNNYEGISSQGSIAFDLSRMVQAVLARIGAGIAIELVAVVHMALFAYLLVASLFMNDAHNVVTILLFLFHGFIMFNYFSRVISCTKVGGSRLRRGTPSRPSSPDPCHEPVIPIREGIQIPLGFLRAKLSAVEIAVIRNAIGD
jgi:hypothetical protein